jgi:polysaccharide export outer membrane protein
MTRPKSTKIRSAAIALMGAALAILGQTAALADNYRVSPGDLVGISVFQEKDLTASYRVRADGSISLPLIGTVTVGGMSPSAASASIRGRLLDGYLVNPQVTLRVVEYAKIRFTVLGQVTTPKSISVPANESLSLLAAIGMAGGPTRLANQRKVTVKRKAGGGGVKLMEFDIKKMAREGGGSVFLIQDGDIITVRESAF